MLRTSEHTRLAWQRGTVLQSDDPAITRVVDRLEHIAVFTSACPGFFGPGTSPVWM